MDHIIITELQKLPDFIGLFGEFYLSKTQVKTRQQDCILIQRHPGAKMISVAADLH